MYLQVDDTTTMLISAEHSAVKETQDSTPATIMDQLKEQIAASVADYGMVFVRISELPDRFTALKAILEDDNKKPNVVWVRDTRNHGGVWSGRTRRKCPEEDGGVDYVVFDFT